MYNDIDSMIDMQDSMKRFVQLIYKIFGPLLCKYQGICRSSQYLFTFEKKTSDRCDNYAFDCHVCDHFYFSLTNTHVFISLQLLRNGRLTNRRKENGF